MTASIKQSWWLQLLLAVVSPIVFIVASYYTAAFIFPGTITQGAWRDYLGIVFLLAFLPVIFLLLRPLGQTPMRILTGVLILLFFFLLALSTRFSTPCGEISDYIGGTVSSDADRDGYISECE